MTLLVFLAGSAGAGLVTADLALIAHDGRLLRIIDREERPQAYAGSRPDADARVLLPAWESSDKAKFEAEAARWAGIVAAYKK